MRVKRDRQETMGFKVTAEVRRLVEQLAARMTVKRGERQTMTDVLEEAVRLLALRENVK